MLPRGPHDLIPDEVLAASSDEKRWPVGLAIVIFYALLIFLGWAMLHPADLPAGPHHWLLTLKSEVAGTMSAPQYSKAARSC
ncbi:MAG TPA: hypothetical protein VKY65_12950 [Alphaproteobacteria bacterium]|nr:hypothetical protein [Alphaproteobacteria bacterium]